MNPTWRLLLSTWDLRIEILLVLFLWVAFFTSVAGDVCGHRGSRLATGWRLASFLAGQVVAVISLLSAIDALSALLFFMHMIQHLLLIMIAAPLIVLGNPFPFVIWGLPGGKQIGPALFRADAPFRKLLEKVTGPGIVWLAFVTVLWGWHDPGAYDLALRSDLVHDLEHLSFYVTALLFWWHVFQVGPHIHKPLSPAARIAYTISIVPANMVAGIAISFASSPLYEFYTSVPRVWGLDVLQDQQLGGTIMWIPGSMMYLLVAIILIGRLVQNQDSDRPRPNPTSVVIPLLLLALLASNPAVLPAEAHGGGVPQLTAEPVGPYRLYVWSKPDPARVGELHFTVGVFEGVDATGAADVPVLDAVVDLQLTELAPAGVEPVVLLGSAAEAGALYYYELDFAVPTAGEWQAAVSVDGPEGGGSASFDLQVLPPGINWTLVGGVLVGLIVIGWFVFSSRSTAPKTG